MAAEPGQGREGEALGFHSSREERLARAGAPRGEAGRYGVMRRNRTLLIVFVDVLLFLIVALFLVRFLYSQTPRARLQGYALELRGLSYGEVVYATLTVKATAGTGRADGGRVYLRLALSAQAPEAEAEFLSAQLPAAEGAEVVLRGTLPGGQGQAVGQTLYAEVRIGDSTRRLSASLTR